MPRALMHSSKGDTTLALLPQPCSVAKIGGLQVLETFECRVCGESLTQAHEPKVLEIDSAVGRFS
jgi:hypothetical protein